MTSIRRAWRTALAVAPFVLLSCDDDDDGPSGNTGTFQIAVSPTAASVEAGGTNFVTVTLTRSGGFSGVVTLSTSGLPTGVTGTIDPPTLSGNTVASQIDFVAAATAVPGTATVTINATSPGATAASATVALTVTPAPDYGLSVEPGALTIAAGSSSSATISINRAAFTGGVTLDLVSPPAGITGTFAPSPSTTNSSTLTLTIGSSVTAGSYSLTIRGTATGIAERTMSLALTVIPAPTAGSNVEYLYCDADQAPVFFAFQDGTGAWQPVTATVSGGATRFAFNVTSGRGGVMAIHQFTVDDGSAARRRGRVSPLNPGPATRLRGSLGAAHEYRAAAEVDVYATQLLYGSTTELAADGVATCALTLPVKDIRATIAGVGQFQYSVLSLGAISDIFQGGVSPNPFTFSGVQDGLVNFTGARLPQTGSPPDRAIIMRNLNIPDGGALPATVDFNGPSAFVPASATVTVTGSNGERLEVYNEVITALGRTLFWNDIAPSTTASRSWAGLNPANTQPGDFHSVIVFAGVASNPDFRVALKFVGPVANQTIALGDAATPATVSQVAAGAYPRFRFQGPVAAEYNRGVALSLNATDVGNFFTAIATAAWLGASGSTSAYDLTMPDVSGLAGFPVASRVTPGTNEVITDMFGFTGAGVFDVQPVLGNEYKGAVRYRTIEVP